MGNIRTPRPHYFNNGVIEFSTKNKVIHYKTMLWSKSGTMQFVFESGIYDESKLNDIVSRALQHHETVEVKS